MNDKLPGFDFIPEKCRGSLVCMRACPTRAIRVRDCKAKVNPKLCIACGECIVACPEGAFKTHTDKWEDVKKFKYKVAIPSPTLFGQFPLDISPEDIAQGLLDIGFDAVHDASIEFELVNMAIKDYIADYDGVEPLISSACPVVVRLIQVAYPEMVKQIIPIEPPREISGREMKKRVSRETGLPPEEIGAIYITPCTAKMVSIKQPAENVKSYLDIALSISDIYNPLLAAITRRKSSGKQSEKKPGFKIRSGINLGWALRGGQSLSLKHSNYLSIAHLSNIIRIFDDIEKGKIKGFEFLECYACLGGCVGGPLTVDDMYVSSRKILKIISDLKADESEIEKEVRDLYVKGDYKMRQPVEPRHIESDDISLDEKVQRVIIRDDFNRMLPGLSCGLCGAPSCEAFAEDVANGESQPSYCVFLSADRIDILKKFYDL